MAKEGRGAIFQSETSKAFTGAVADDDGLPVDAVPFLAPLNSTPPRAFLSRVMTHAPSAAAALLGPPAMNTETAENFSSHPWFFWPAVVALAIGAVGATILAVLAFSRGTTKRRPRIGKNRGERIGRDGLGSAVLLFKDTTIDGVLYVGGGLMTFVDGKRKNFQVPLDARTGPFPPGSTVYFDMDEEPHMIKIVSAIRPNGVDYAPGVYAVVLGWGNAVRIVPSPLSAIKRNPYNDKVYLVRLRGDPANDDGSGAAFVMPALGAMSGLDALKAGIILSVVALVCWGFYAAYRKRRLEKEWGAVAAIFEAMRSTLDRIRTQRQAENTIAYLQAASARLESRLESPDIAATSVAGITLTDTEWEKLKGISSITRSGESTDFKLREGTTIREEYFPRNSVLTFTQDKVLVGRIKPHLDPSLN